jgi:hypothetical protein
MSDPAQSSDGLLALQAKRAASKRRGGFKRTIPPSQNPTTLPPYKAPEMSADLAAREVPEPGSGVAASTPPPPAEKPSPGGAKKAAPETEAQIRLTVYVDDAHDAFMDDVRFAGARRRPRIDVSRSAVVRFALDRLKAEMTPEQIHNAIADKPVDPKATGRKRR